MMEWAFLFPGQASQFVGMGRDLFERFEPAREIFARADEVLGFPLSELCFSGPEERLNQTEITQPAVFVHSAAVCRILALADIEPRCVIGHSLGEYSALVAAGALDFEVGLELVRWRGEVMQKAGRRRPGVMLAILGLEEEKVVELCRKAAERGIVVPANFNAPGQVVVSGEVVPVSLLKEWAFQAGAKKVVDLPVSGAFHSPLVESAAREMEARLQSVEIRSPRVPVITNVSARPVSDPEELRSHLIDQMTHPVRWVESIRTLSGMGVRKALEVGPGTVLKKLVRRIDRGVEVVSVGTAEQIAALAEHFEVNDLSTMRGSGA